MIKNITPGPGITINNNYSTWPSFYNTVSSTGNSLIGQLRYNGSSQNLEVFDETKRNKTRRQFEDWNANVHANIQVNISKQVEKMDPKALNRKKNDDYSKFLEITNRKPAIFRDIIIESECTYCKYIYMYVL